MEPVVPWPELVALIEPDYPKAAQGHPPVGVERMLRIYFLQQLFNLSNLGVEDALYDSNAMRGFVGIDLGREPVPDETTVCKFRHLLERHKLGGRIFAAVNAYLSQQGLQIGAGTSQAVLGYLDLEGAVFDQERRAGHATRRCTRCARAGSGTSARKRMWVWTLGPC